MTASPPSGTVTFLLTDLEGSTRLWEQNPEAMKAAMVCHDELLEKLIAAHRGHVFARMGDGMAAAFATAKDAVTAAAAFQHALAAESWPTAQPLRARIGLHTDEAAIVDDTGYASLPINRCSRLMTAAHGGQTLVSGATEVLVRGHLPDGCVLSDLGEHRLRDLGRPMRIFQLIHGESPSSFPPLRTLDSFPGNLPAQISSFIGRETDVARVSNALGASRVVTITGVGGVGKTRLALQVAADLLPDYRDGVWLVELAPVRDAEGVAAAVAAVFGVVNSAGQTLDDSLLDMLGHKHLLLLLDNCEHVLGALARLVGRIERGCPGVVVLATSREGMAIEGEQLIALAPLAVGQPGDDIRRLSQTDAVSLFVERARQVKSDFALTRSNERAVVEACQRLDGVPLAIELAAARVIAMSPAELVERLDRRFQVLAGARRGAVERHATLRAAIDWSYELLDRAEQRLLARLSVFPGGCTLTAAEEICSGDPVAPEAIMDLVANLVARSLLIAEDGGHGTRYRLLETIRQYSEERLAAFGETETLRIRHARFYADLSVRANQHYYGPEQLEWARRVRAEIDNTRTALTNAIDAGDAKQAVRLIASQPHQEKAEGPTGQVLMLPVLPVVDLPGADKEPGYPLVLLVAAYTTQATGDWDATFEFCRRAREAEQSLAVSDHGHRIEMDIASLQAQAALAGGDYSGAVSAYTRAAEFADADGYTGLAGIFLAYGVTSGLLGGVGTESAAIARAEQAVALARRSGMPAALILTLNALALALVERDPARSRAVLEESIELASVPDEEVASGILTATLVAGRLRDWRRTLMLSVQTMKLWRWSVALMQSAPCLGLCARALAEEMPEVAGVLRGAAYAAYAQASPVNSVPQGATHAGADVNFALNALREAGDLVTAALGEERRRELREQGAAMSMDEAISYALSNIDPRLAGSPDFEPDHRTWSPLLPGQEGNYEH
ncbi:NB-ARC domain-containing protein [Mycobacterium sp. E740]|uniref:ATP-binding protein n=1 Tax=Mycobacterium sp. E740 TaxID=1834149 RepID=UPI000AA8A4C1|nr:NB-ARC domain-containing protein [Mycobacterium sp. E740]